MGKKIESSGMQIGRISVSFAAAVIAIAALDGCDSSRSGETPPGSGGTARASLGSTALPCDIQEALRLGCQSCHASTPIAGAPMALVTWEDMMAPSVTNPSVTVAQLVSARINTTDSALVMPPPVAQNAATAIVWERLNGHHQAGSPPNSDPACGGGGTGGTGGVAGNVSGGTGGYGGMGGVGAVGGDAGTGGFGAVGGTGGITGDGNCYEFPVHAQSAPGDKTPFPVSGQFYSAFYYDMPWDGDAQAISFRSKFDGRSDIVHHWLVYLDENDNQADGTVVAQGSGTHPSNPTLIAGWAPGADNNNDLPADVGISMTSPNRKLLIEVHWYNSGAPHNSTFAIEICTAETPRPNSATISWLGSEAIFLNAGVQTTVSGSCAPASAFGVPYTGDIHIVRSWPHMHKLGYRMDSHIIRANGQRELLFDELFSFDNQISYPTPQVLHPGDKIETRCYYNNTAGRFVGIGYNSEDEMCFNFMTAYPPGALKSFGFLGAPSTLTSSSTGCLF